jgi:hypothetical protein
MHEEILKSRSEKSSSFLGVKLNPGISALNFFSFLLLNFVVFTCIQFVLSFVSFILADPNYYGIKDELGEKMGEIASYAELYVII